MNKRKTSKSGYTMREALERSSFGTPAAKRLRSTTSDETAARILERAKTISTNRARRMG